MNSKRLLATLPQQTVRYLRAFAKQQHMDHSLVIQQAITKMSDTRPGSEDVKYIRGDTEQIQVSLSDTAYRLLELWREQTGLSKSLLIAYSLQNTIEQQEQIEKEEKEGMKDE